MTTVDQVKDRFLIKAEKNGINDGIAVDNLRFSLLYKEAQDKFLTLHLQNRGTDDIRYVQHFLQKDKSIPLHSKSNGIFNFEIPKNYFDISNVRAVANKENCTDDITLIEVQTENIGDILQDEFSKPSFEWRETLYTLNSSLISVHTDKTFKIDKLFLSYYRYPKQIELIDENNPESGFTSESTIEWDDKSLDDIVSLMVFNLDINSNNPRFQLQTLRTQK